MRVLRNKRLGHNLVFNKFRRLKKEKNQDDEAPLDEREAEIQNAKTEERRRHFCSPSY